MIRFLARYEVVVVSSQLGTRVFRFTNRHEAVWALRVGKVASLGLGTKVTARDRWTGRAVTA